MNKKKLKKLIWWKELNELIYLILAILFGITFVFTGKLSYLVIGFLSLIVFRLTEITRIQTENQLNK